jgi:hypothetical protein
MIGLILISCLKIICRNFVTCKNGCEAKLHWRSTLAIFFTNQKTGKENFVLKLSLVLFITAGILLASPSSLNAQAPYFKNIVYDKEKKEARLLKIYQDKKGYIWLGTNFGICRYDGIDFKYLEKDSNLVTTITENNNGVLWFGHINGVIEYIENNTLFKFMPEEGLP